MTTLDARMPRTPEEINAWATAFNRTIEDSWQRFAHYVVLQCLASDPDVPSHLVLHGGAACWFAYGSPRTPRDVDIAILGYQNDLVTDLQRSQTLSLVGRALSRWAPQFCNGFENHRQVIQRLANVDLFAIPREIGLAEVVVNEGLGLRLLATDLNTTFSRKFFAILRRFSLGMTAAQDVFDLAWLTQRYRARLSMKDLADAASKDADFSQVFSNRVTPMSIYTPAVKAHCEKAYDNLRNHVGASFIDFPTAWKTTTDFMNELCAALSLNDRSRF